MKPSSDSGHESERRTLSGAKRSVDPRVFQHVAMHSSEAIMITIVDPVDGVQRIVYVNAAFETMTGFAWPEAVGKSPSILYGPKTDPTSRATILTAMKSLKSIDVEILTYRKDGSDFLSEARIFPIADDAGIELYWVSIRHDISGRQLIEAGVRDAEAKASALGLEIDRRIRRETQLAYAAFHDELTGLRNRAYLLQRIEIALEETRAAPPGTRSFAMLFIDLDRFKVVNDSLGHGLGDDLLRQVAVRLGLAIRAEDTLARIGGDEFVILLDSGGTVEASSVARRVIASLQTPIVFGDHGFVVTPSIGIAHWHPDHQTADSLMRDADTAMYAAKQGGGNRFEIFTEPMHDAAMASMRLYTDLRYAIERDEFVLQYQPILDVPAERIAGIEVLIRWDHPARGRLAPSEFIPLAEEIGLIGELGAWVLRRACVDAAAWRKRFDSNLSIWVNISTRQLLDVSFVTTVARALRESGLPPSLLVLEITESAFLAGPLIADAIVVALRAIGVRIALDDFGTGYSSLSHLGGLTIDILKIDRSFVAGVDDPSTRRQLVRTIMSLAECLTIGTVAEGVETAAQRDALLALGCAQMQGFFFAQPLDAADATAFIARLTTPHRRVRRTRS